MTDELDEGLALLRLSVAANPGDDSFVELANLMAESPATRAEAREICFKGIVANPNALRGRLVLARLFYLDNLFEFAARELAELSNFAEVPALDKLMEALSGHLRVPNRINPNAGAGSGASADDDEEDEVLAEIDLDAGFAEALNELDEK